MAIHRRDRELDLFGHCPGLGQRQPEPEHTSSFRIFVRNVTPLVDIVLGTSFPSNTSLVRTGSFSDPGADTWTATVDYGDGTGRQPLSLTSDKRFQLKHSYAVAGTYSVTTTVTDKDGAVGSTTVKVTVTSSQPPASGFGSGRDAFVTALYRENLGRLPEPSGLRFWSGLLARKIQPRTVAFAIWRSPEHRSLLSRHVVSLFPFGVRTPTPWLPAGKPSGPTSRHLRDPFSAPRTG